MTPRCPAHLGSPTGLACVLPQGHAWGHTYHSTSGVPECAKEEM